MIVTVCVTHPNFCFCLLKSYYVFIKLNINLRYGGPVSKGGDFQLKKSALADQKKLV